MEWPQIVRSIFSEESAFALAVGIVVLGLLLAFYVWRWTHKLLRRTGIHDAVEGTPFDRKAQSVGTSTTGIIAQLTALAVYVTCVIIALQIAQLLDVQTFWPRVTAYLPRVLIAAIAIVTGLIAGDKADIAIRDRLQSIKLPEATIIPVIVKYSIFYIAVLIALSQIGVATEALLVLLAACTFGIVFLGGIAFKDLLTASAAGIYLLLTEPYTIGDEVRIDEKRGVVQEIDMFVTRIETDGEEYIIPNQRVFRSGIIRIRE